MIKSLGQCRCWNSRQKNWKNSNVPDWLLSCYGKHEQATGTARPKRV